ncbi:hypothetical protein [Loigolactobacillus bifermentans]|uniref:hypothetical protein n=1 Tax=Loigolactobacillus bifermentans TaxID=1607 RepID=UPI0012AA2EA6|nr:hypothetical protein [Loigolactobacillus bifermentans]QGG61518.1 hypothetical protein LB003_14220 [Loigolactobacillus bifermentans]
MTSLVHWASLNAATLGLVAINAGGQAKADVVALENVAAVLAAHHNAVSGKPRSIAEF